MEGETCHMNYRPYRLTISPDPTRIVNKAQKRSFYACTKQEQYNILKSSIRKAVFNTQQSYNYPIHVNVYFEFNEMMMLHCHGTVTFYTGYYSIQDEMSKYFQRMIFRELGRAFIKGNVNTLVNACCDITVKEWSQDLIINGEITKSPYKSWLDYCLKDQSEQHVKYYPYFHFVSDAYDPKDLDIEQKNIIF